MRIDTGMSVRTTDGQEIGTVDRVILDPDTKEVDTVVVRGNASVGRDIIVHLSLVEGLREDGVHLRIGQDRLRDLPEFRDTRLHGDQGALRPDVDITRGTMVHAVDGTVGIVDEVRTDPLTDRVTVLVVRAGLGLSKNTEIPIEYVTDIEGDYVKLGLTKEQVEDLPAPTRDRYITVEGREEQQP